MNPMRTVDIIPWRRRVTVYTDASCAPRSEGKFPRVDLCYLLVSDCGYRSSGIATLSDEILASFLEKHTYIAHGEALAILFAIIHEKDVLKQKSVVWYMNNFGVLSCLCKGSSAVADFGCIIHAILLCMAALKVRAWYDHVDSKANAADDGTRNSSEASDKLGITLRERSCPVWPPNTLGAKPEVWMQWLTLQCF